MSSGTGTSRSSVSAREAADRFFAYVASLKATSEISKAGVQEAMHVTLVKHGEGEIYVSPDMGGGWTFVVKRLDATEHMKAGLSFGFFNVDAEASPQSICAIDMEYIRAALVPHGFTESVSLGEIGQTVSVNFIKNDIVLTITPGAMVARPDGSSCVRMIQSTDGWNMWDAEKCDYVGASMSARLEISYGTLSGANEISLTLGGKYGRLSTPCLARRRLVWRVV